VREPRPLIWAAPRQQSHPAGAEERGTHRSSSAPSQSAGCWAWRRRRRRPASWPPRGGAQPCPSAAAVANGGGGTRQARQSRTGDTRQAEQAVSQERLAGGAGGRRPEGSCGCSTLGPEHVVGPPAAQGQVRTLPAPPERKPCNVRGMGTHHGHRCVWTCGVTRD
jgi:hypothetical protein